MGRIFISYSHKDSETVSFINDFLTKNHVFTWFDRKSIAPGSHWETNIVTSISSCNTFLVFHSRNYTASTFCRREWELIVDRNRAVAPTVIVVGLDDSRDSLVFDDVTRYQFVDFDYRNGTKNELGEMLLSMKEIRRCSLAASEAPAVLSGSAFFDALQSMHNPKHYETLETLTRFALFLKEEEKKGRYLSAEADFGDLIATLLADGSLELVPVSSAYSDVPDTAAREKFFRNVFYAMFKYSAAYRFGTPPPALEFGSPYTSASHRFAKQTAEYNWKETVHYNADEEIYALFNHRIAQIYEELPDLDRIADALSDILNASKFYESQETRYDGSRSIDYEYTPLVLTIARALFMIQNPLRTDLCDKCIPQLRGEAETVSCHTAFERSDEDLYLHGNDGGGKTSILLDLFYSYPRTLYIDLARGLYFGVREVLRGVLSGMDPSCYKLDFAGLFKYSLYRERVTLLVDGIEMLSEKNRERILAEIRELRDIFRIVLVSTKIDPEEKLSLTVSGNFLDGFRRYEICPPEKGQIVEYIRFRLGKFQTPCAENIVREFERLGEDDSLFLFFNSFTKLDILLGAISDWNNFSIENLHHEFNTRIKVYQRIFESHSEYSMKRKIASYFRGLVVDIEDIILMVVDSEVEAIKKMAYENTALPVPIREASKLRFRDYYPVLSQILGEYFFVNEDIRNYFVASYINSVVRKEPPTPEVLEELLVPIETNYGVLEYLHEFDLLNTLGDIELFLEECAGRERLVLILYRLIQYYDGEKVLNEFLRCVSFRTIPDKFFFRAANIKRVVVPPCVSEIGRAAFANMPLLKEIDFAPFGNGSPLSIRPWAILNCPSLERIRLGRNYMQYRHPLFGHCNALRKIELDPSNPAFSTLLNGQILTSKDGKTLLCSVNSLAGELRIPEGVEVIGNNALSYLKKVTKIFLPASLREANTNFTDFCDVLTRIDVDKNNPVFHSDEDGLIYIDREDGKTLFRVPSGKTGGLKIGADVAVIGSDSISCCSYLNEIFVPASVHLIENYAFADTYALQKIVFEDIDRVTTFGNYIFLSANPRVRIFGGTEYDLAGFHAAYSRPKSDDRLKGIVRRPITSELFQQHGLELLQQGKLKEHYSAAVLVRDVTLFNDRTYYEKDFNILLIGLTEYNAILTRDKQEADDYVAGLIEKFHISAVVLSRDLPLVSQLESKEKYGHLLIARGEGGSTAVTKKIAAIIAHLGENYD